MQNDFVLPDALRPPWPEPGRPFRSFAALAEYARNRSWPVIHVVREHRADGSDVEYTAAGFVSEWRRVCVAGTPGARIVDELTPQTGDYV
jgi:nicotinamidase-related amidase